MFIRVVTTRIHKDSHKAEGVFAAAYSLLDSGLLDSNEWKKLREILIWFNKNLPHPPERFSANRAIFRFKSDAKESIGRVRDLVQMLSINYGPWRDRVIIRPELSFPHPKKH
jgi:hypothetical protein